MAAPSTDHLADLEKLRLALEENLRTLRASLRHWQTWEAEYEGLKEEVGALGLQGSRADMLRVGADFGGELVNEKEMRDLLGPAAGVERTPTQVCDRISRRIDYVQQNVATITKQIDVAEGKLERAMMISLPVEGGETGLPLAEIHEELDDDGNVISSTVRHPAESAASIVEALGKAGVKEVELEETSTSSLLEAANVNDTAPAELSPAVAETSSIKTVESSPNQAELQQPSEAEGETVVKPRKKSVTFANDTKSGDSDTTKSQKQDNPARYGSASSLSEFVKGTFKEGDRVIELNDNYEVINTVPIIPANESRKDAALRRQMLEYNMPEIGSIVAQIDLDEPGSQESDSDEDYMDVDDLGTTSSMEDEDEYGMSTNGRISDDYRAEMIALEQKLNAQAMQNIGPQTNLGSDVAALENPPVLPKSVRFAENIDIAPSKPFPGKPATLFQPSDAQLPTTKDIISERSDETPKDTNGTSTTPKRTPKVSRFKASRNRPTGPPEPRPGPSEILFPDKPETNSSATDATPPKVLSNIIERGASAQPRILPSQPQSSTKPNLQDLDGSIEDDYEDAYEDNYEYDDPDAMETEMEGFPRKKISMFKAARLRAMRGLPPR